MRPAAPVLLALASLILAACVPAEPEPTAVGLGNPASVHCAKVGGRVVIRNTPEGQVGDCHLPDGRVVEEWALFRQAQGT
jgi:putative hemolysin